MFDRELALDCLSNIENALQLIVERSLMIGAVNDFLCSSEGMLRLDAICMNLIALGETVKGLDKVTKGELLSQYPDIYWPGVMRMRDKIAHHYFEMDADIVFNTIKKDIPPMIPIIQKIIQRLQCL